jgi:hypothetical protein
MTTIKQGQPADSDRIRIIYDLPEFASNLKPNTIVRLNMIDRNRTNSFKG